MRFALLCIVAVRSPTEAKFHFFPPFSFTLLPCKNPIKTAAEKNHNQSEVAVNMGGSCQGGDDLVENIRSCDCQVFMIISHDIRRRARIKGTESSE